MTFSAEIANAGTGAAAAFIVQLKIDGLVRGAVSLPGLAPGASATVDFPPWPATFGAHRVRATADALRQIAEPNEHNQTHLQRRVVVTDEVTRPAGPRSRGPEPRPVRPARGPAGLVPRWRTCTTVAATPSTRSPCASTWTA